MKRQMRKGLLSCIVMLTMVISLSFISDKQAFATTGTLSKDTTFSVNTVFANGNAILLMAGSDSNYTNVYFDTYPIGEYNGEEPINLNSSDLFNGSLTASTIERGGFDLSAVSFYGGSKDSTVDGSTRITMLSGRIKEIKGGGYASGSGSSNITGNTYIEVTGGTITETIFGGGYVYASGHANITGNTYINVNGGSIGNIYGGGMGIGTNIGGDTNIVLTGGTIGNVYGGAYNGNVTGNTSIVVEGATINFDIFGGGMSSMGTGRVDGSSYITFNAGSTIKGSIYGSGYYSDTVGTGTNITINGGSFSCASYIYGGGNSAKVGSATNAANTNITFSGNVMISGGSSSVLMVYGGGNPGIVYGNTNITVSEGTSSNSAVSIYGGGCTFNGMNPIISDVTGNVSILIASGNIGSVFVGGDANVNVTSSHSATVGGTARIDISGGSVNSLYLGGNGVKGQVGNANASITGGTTQRILTGTVSDSGTAELNITGGTITGTVASELSKSIEFTGLSANGDLAPPTTELTLTFNENPVTLTESRIQVTGATKGTLSGTGTTRKLSLSNITVANGGNITVNITDAAPGFKFTPATRTVAVYKDVPTLTNITILPTVVHYFNRAIAGTKVADLAVTGTPTTGITYELDAGGTHNHLFQIVGSELQIKGGATLNAQDYSVKVKVSEDAKPLNTVTKVINVPVDLAPVVISIDRANPVTDSTNSSSVTYRVTFSEVVSGVDTGDFTLTTTGDATGSIASVSAASGNVIDVTVNTVTGQGTIRLDLKASGTGITDATGNAVAGFTGGQIYMVDRIAPTLTAGSVSRTSDTNATVRFTSSEAGKYYYVVVVSGAAQPTIDTTGEGINCVTGENTITLTTLSTGAKDIYIVVKDALGNVSLDTFKISIPAYALPSDNGGGSSGGGGYSGGGNGGGSNGSGAAGNSKEDANKAVEIRINDITVNAGTKVETEVEGKTVTTVSLDEKLIEDKLTDEEKNVVITIPITNASSDALVTELNGQMVKNMEQKAAVIEIKTDAATYIIPASQIDIENISKKMGRDIELSDIKVKVEIAKTSAETNAMIENTANNDNFTVVAAPIEFSVSCTYGGETVNVSRFNNYVQRIVIIPTNTDTDKITTGVVVDADGTVRHVPTKVEVIDGRYYARINSLTNSTYAVIWNPIAYKDVKNNSTGKAINDLGSRLVISGAKNNKFRPDSNITRAEFVAMLVTSLGLEPGTEDTVYKDVKLKDWYGQYIEAANEYGIISGTAKAKFRPNDKITAEEAATMLANAMKITELKVKFKKGEASKLLASLAKSGKAQKWADNSMAECIKAGLIKSNQKISPKSKFTRAEAAVMIRNLLVKSNLI